MPSSGGSTRPSAPGTPRIWWQVPHPYCRAATRPRAGSPPASSTTISRAAEAARARSRLTTRASDTPEPLRDEPQRGEQIRDATRHPHDEPGELLVLQRRQVPERRLRRTLGTRAGVPASAARQDRRCTPSWRRATGSQRRGAHGAMRRAEPTTRRAAPRRRATSGGTARSTVPARGAIRPAVPTATPRTAAPAPAAGPRPPSAARAESCARRAALPPAGEAARPARRRAAPTPPRRRRLPAAAPACGRRRERAAASFRPRRARPRHRGRAGPPAPSSMPSTDREARVARRRAGGARVQSLAEIRKRLADHSATMSSAAKTLVSAPHRLHSRHPSRPPPAATRTRARKLRPAHAGSSVVYASSRTGRNPRRR